MSARRRWVTTTFPRAATFDTVSPEPADYLAGMLCQALRHGMPARRRGGPLLAWMGRWGLPRAPLAAGLRRLPARPAPALDLLLERVGAAWPELAAASRGLPSNPPPLTALAVQRSAARTVFVFGGRRLLMVVKQPGDERAGVEREASALRAAAAADIAPRLLGYVDRAPVQEGLLGAPLLVPPVRPSEAHALERCQAFDGLGAALARLAATTAGQRDLRPQLFGPLEAALSSGALSAHAERLLRAARRDLGRLELSVLQHRDLSAQNWLVADGGFVGLVDWETAMPAGVPGFDALHAGVSVLEHGVGLVRWSEDRVVRAFGSAWRASGLFEGVRAAFRASALAAEVPERLLDPLQLAFFGRRLGRRLAPHAVTDGAPSAFAAPSPFTHAAAVEVVCRE